jgi:hypothetical protein
VFGQAVSKVQRLAVPVSAARQDRLRLPFAAAVVAQVFVAVVAV